MDGQRFDRLTRALASVPNRRQVVRGMIGSIAGGRGLGSLRVTDAVICRNDGVLCAKDAQCCSHSCDAKTHRCMASSFGGSAPTNSAELADGASRGKIISQAAKNTSYNLIGRYLAQQGFSADNVEPMALVVSRDGALAWTMTVDFVFRNDQVAGLVYAVAPSGGVSAFAAVAVGGAVGYLLSIANGKVRQTAAGTGIAPPIAADITLLSAAVPRTTAADARLAAPITNDCDLCRQWCGWTWNIAATITTGGAEALGPAAVCLGAALTYCRYTSPTDTLGCLQTPYDICSEFMDFLTNETLIDAGFKLTTCEFACYTQNLGYCPDCDTPRSCPAGQHWDSGDCHCVGADAGCSGFTRCGDTCVDTASNLTNCGGCANVPNSGDHVCTGDTTCQHGKCQCPAGSTLCLGTGSVSAPGPKCVPNCPSGQSIDQGSCACTCNPHSGQLVPLTACGDQCVDTTNDPKNCGGCGNPTTHDHICGDSQTCTSGQCQAACVPTGGLCSDTSQCCPGTNEVCTWRGICEVPGTLEIYSEDQQGNPYPNAVEFDIYNENNFVITAPSIVTSSPGGFPWSYNALSPGHYSVVAISEVLAAPSMPLDQRTFEISAGQTTTLEFRFGNPCGEQLQICDNRCVDTASDVGNCGGCGVDDPSHVCASGQTCVNGVCVSPAGTPSA